MSAIMFRPQWFNKRSIRYHVADLYTASAEYRSSVYSLPMIPRHQLRVSVCSLQTGDSESLDTIQLVEG